jgi:hypothetical protein
MTIGGLSAKSVRVKPKLLFPRFQESSTEEEEGGKGGVSARDAADMENEFQVRATPCSNPFSCTTCLCAEMWWNRGASLFESENRNTGIRNSSRLLR